MNRSAGPRTSWKPGRATLTITAFDLLSGAVDGINDAGLVAALLSDDESTTGGGSAGGLEPTFAPAVGLSEVELCRFVLETCGDVDEALGALRLARHYYFFHPQHFIIADRSGRSFVFEYGPAHNGEHVIWGEGLQIVTNHLLYRYPTTDALPSGEGIAGTFARFRTLKAAFSNQAGYAPEEIIERHAKVRFIQPHSSVRTLWYVLYDTEAKSMRVSFHLKDSDQGR
jgi:Acyl-coenzyme A:6-aminopenicillanic acid acyl-transferase